MNFGHRLKEIRTEKRLKQDDMAKLLLIDASSYSRYETNAQTPNSEFLIRVAQQFNKSTDWLLGYENGNPININHMVSREILEIIQKQIQMEDVMVNTCQQQALLLQRLVNKMLSD